MMFVRGYDNKIVILIVSMNSRQNNHNRKTHDYFNEIFLNEKLPANVKITLFFLLYLRL